MSPKGQNTRHKKKPARALAILKKDSERKDKSKENKIKGKK